MSSTKILYGLYDDDDVLLAGVKRIREEGIHIDEVYSPFPIHGLDKALGLKETRLGIASFLYGLFGLSFAIWMTWYMMIYDWPQDIGGKPSFTWGENMPAFVPIMFELTIFFAAHLMVVTYLVRNGMHPGARATNPHPATTGDKFLMEISVRDAEESKVIDLLKETGAIEINLKHAEA